MRKVQELTSADFHGIDSLKFEEWKQSLVDANRNLIYFFLALLAIGVILYLAFDIIATPGILLILVAQGFIFRKSGRLFKELGLTRKDLNEVRRRPSPPAL